VSAFALLAALPVAAFEFSLGVYLVAKGFKPSPITSQPVRTIDWTPELTPA
jgi:hypothetical protein